MLRGEKRRPRTTGAVFTSCESVYGWQSRLITCVDTRWVAKPACTDTSPAGWVGCNVIDDVVRSCRVTANAANRGAKVIEADVVTDAPSNHRVSTGGITANTNCPDDLVVYIVKPKATPEDVNAAGFSANHRIIVLSIFCSVAAISDAGVNRVTVLQAKQTAAGLHRRKQVAGGKRKAVEAEGVSGIGLLRGDYPATGPLRPTISAGKGNRTNDAIPVNNRGPHVEVKAAGLSANSGTECRRKRGMVG